MVISKISSRWKNSRKETCLAIVKNEVTWGIFLILCCAISLIIIWVSNSPVQWQKYKDPFHAQGLIVIIGGICAFVATMMSFVQVLQHFLHKSHRQSQKRIMRILAMVPLYAITSWISLLFFASAIYMDFIKSCFEAYILYSFIMLLTKYLGGHRGVEQVMLSLEIIILPFPFSCMKPKPSEKWVWYFKFGILQYTWITPICSGVAVVLNLAGVYNSGHWQFTTGYLYIIIIINVSQTVALYYLIAFYTNTKEALKPFKPLPKFIAIKLIVFFIFWQSVLMSGLATADILKSTTCDSKTNTNCNGSSVGFTVEEEKILLENILICVEMVFFSIAHHWIFGWKQYADGSFKKLMESRYRNMNDNKEDADIGSFMTWV
jgi:hypothetical protein